MNLLIRGGRLLDPASGRDAALDLEIVSGKVRRIGRALKNANARVIEARGLWVMPGLVDVHVHLREPGGERSETIETGTRAAAAGGVTSLLAMANTKPVTDDPDKVRFVVERATQTACVKVYPVGAVTKNLDGRELTDIAGMVQAGARAVSDDGRCIMDSALLRRALELCKAQKIVLIEHCEDENLSRAGILHEGPAARKLGLRGIPTESETVMVARNIYLSQLTGAPLHCAHVSTKDAVELIRLAKKKGIHVSAETCPHYFTLTDRDVEKHGALAKMKPPLRTAEDQKAVREGLRDGTIDMIATDHAPHDAESKSRGLSEAPFGILGMATMFALAYNELILKKILSPLEAVRRMSLAPARVFNLPAGKLAPGADADVAIFDPRADWTVRAEDFHSKSSNSPFIGRKLKGRMACTLVQGREVYRHGLSAA